VMPIISARQDRCCDSSSQRASFAADIVVRRSARG
jgi:hypothetical protein